MSELLQDAKAKRVELLDTKQAAEFLQVSPGTLMVWRCEKTYALRYVKIGAKVRYRRSDLEAFLSARTMSGVGGELHSRRSRGRGR